MSTKFGLLIVYDLQNTVASTNRKPEVELSSQAAILKMDISSYVRSRWSHFDDIGHPSAK